MHRMVIKHGDFICGGIEKVVKKQVGKFSEAIKCNPRSHPRHHVGKDKKELVTTKDIISDSRMNSDFPCRWSQGYARVHMIVTD